MSSGVQNADGTWCFYPLIIPASSSPSDWALPSFAPKGNNTVLLVAATLAAVAVVYVISRKSSQRRSRR